MASRQAVFELAALEVDDYFEKPVPFRVLLEALNRKDEVEELGAPPMPRVDLDAGLDALLNAVRAAEIRRALERHSGNITAAARSLRLKRETLRYWLRKRSD